MIKEIIIALISALFGGLITLLFERRKEKREEKLETKRQQQEAFQNRPEMEIVEYNYFLNKPGVSIYEKCDISIFVARLMGVSLAGDKKTKKVQAHFENNILNSDEWCCVLYTFKNVGKTNISVTDIFCNDKKNVCIFSTNEANQFINCGMLNYSVLSDKKIRTDETLTVKFCYYKNSIIISSISALMSIGMKDDNGRLWMQPLFAPTEKLYDSIQVSSKQYYDEIGIECAEEYFKKRCFDDDRV